MHLPEDPNKRMQVIAGIAVAIVAAAYGVYSFVYKPLVDARQEAIDEIASLETRLDRAQQQIRQVGDLRTESIQLATDSIHLSETYMLHPRLGNYILEARQIVQDHARPHQIQQLRIEEVGLSDLPRRRGGNRDVLVQGYAVRVQANASYQALHNWIADLQESNPLLMIQSLVITAQSERPQLHQVRMEVHWPTWLDPAMRGTVRDTARDITERHGS